jgi:hypothetical protein
MRRRPPKPTDQPASPPYRRRSRSQAQGDAESRPIIDLMREVPDGLSAYNALLGLLDATPKQTTIDRAAAIIGTAFLEHALKTAISKHLRADLSKRDNDKMLVGIFDDYPAAPLSSLFFKTRMAYALGIIDRLTQHNLDRLRRIRNYFAHSASEIELITPEVEKLINELSPPPHSTTERAWGAMPPRGKFTSTIFVYYWMLLNYERAA